MQNNQSLQSKLSLDNFSFNSYRKPIDIPEEWLEEVSLDEVISLDCVNLKNKGANTDEH